MKVNIKKLIREEVKKVTEINAYSFNDKVGIDDVKKEMFSRLDKVKSRVQKFFTGKIDAYDKFTPTDLDVLGGGITKRWVNLELKLTSIIDAFKQSVENDLKRKFPAEDDAISIFINLINEKLADLEYTELLVAKRPTNQDYTSADIIIKPRYKNKQYEKDDTKDIDVWLKTDNTLRIRYYPPKSSHSKEKVFNDIDEFLEFLDDILESDGYFWKEPVTKVKKTTSYI